MPPTQTPCPECGYMMSAFEKDCPRCERMGERLKPCLKCGTALAATAAACSRCAYRVGTPVEDAGGPYPSPAAVPLPDDTFPEPAQGEASAAPHGGNGKPSRRLSSFTIVALILTALFVGFIAVAVLSAAATEQAEAAKQTRIEQNKQDGLRQCVAGDVEGCHYAMDRLRDAGLPDDAEFLKAHLIVSVALDRGQAAYRDNGGATSAEYVSDAKEIDDLTFLHAYRGDADYALYRSASSAATFLADYGPAHGLSGRY